MSSDGNLVTLDSFREKRISTAKKGLAYAIISAITMVIFTLFNSTAQTIVLEMTGSDKLITQIVVGLVVLATAEFAAGIIIIIYTMVMGTPLSEYKNLWGVKASRFTILSALAAGPVATCSLMIACTLCGVTYANSLLSLAPMVSAIAARIIFKEKPKVRVYIGIALAITGVIIASYEPPVGVENFYLGILIATLSPIGFAIEAMLSSKVMDSTDPLEVCGLYRCLFGGIWGCLIALLICLFTGDMGLYADVFKFTFTTPTTLIYFVVAAVFIAIEYGTIYVAYNYCGPTRGTAIVFSTPIWSIPIGYMLNGLFPYTVTPLGIIGAIVVVVGMVLIVLKPSELFSLREFK